MTTEKTRPIGRVFCLEWIRLDWIVLFFFRERRKEPKEESDCEKGVGLVHNPRRLLGADCDLYKDFVFFWHIAQQVC